MREARALYQELGDVRGEANCLMNLARVGIDLGENEAAWEDLEAALALFRRSGSLLGEANCLKNMGFIEIRRSALDAARTLLDKAIHLSRRVGSLLAEANCLMEMSKVARALSDPEGAEKLLLQARLRYQRVGQVYGSANTAEALGELAAQQKDLLKARTWFSEALAGFRQIPHRMSIGRVHLHLAQLAPPGSPECHEQIEAARQVWQEAGLLEQKRGEIEVVERARL